MYWILVTSFLSLLGFTSAVSAADLPDPVGCADYETNRTGSDPDCDAAISRETDAANKSVMLFRRAYMEDALGDFSTYPKALADLDEAVRLLPSNSWAYGERGYLYNEFGRWKDARADLDAKVMQVPTSAPAYRERAMAEFGLGDLQATFEDRNTVVLLLPDEPLPLVWRAWAQMWLGRFEAAQKDLDAAALLEQRDSDKKSKDAIAGVRKDLRRWTTAGDQAGARARCAAAKTDKEFTSPTFIGDCTRAFLDGASGAKKADALTQRATALPLVEQDRGAGLDDLRTAYALDSLNPDRAFNLGSLLQAIGSYTESMRYLDMAIAAKPTYFAYAARAGAKNGLNDFKGGFADAKKSFEIQPNELALLQIGDAVYARSKSYDDAKTYWIAAYHMGMRDDALIERLRKASVSVPLPANSVPAKLPTLQ